MNPVKISKRQLLPLTGAVSIGLLISLVLFLAFRNLEMQNAQSAFERIAHERFDGLEVNLARNLNDVVSLGAFFDASQAVNRRDFARLTAPLLEENNALQALGWSPRVRKNLRRSYEDAARRDGLASFEFREVLSQGSIVRARERSEYFPVFFVEPLAGNENALGFDILSSAARREAIRRSTDTGGMTATSRVTLVQQASDQYGVLILRPVYQRGAHPSSEKERRATLAGAVFGVLRLKDVVEKTGQAGTAAHSLGLVIVDLDAPPAERLIYPRDPSFSPSAALPAGFRTTRTISVAGRRWQLAAYSLPGTFAVEVWSSWGALAAGLLMTGFCTAYLRLILNRHSTVEQTVVVRTGALQTALAKLEEGEARYRKLVDLLPDAILVGQNQAITLANKAAVALFGVSTASDLIGRRLADFVSLEQRSSTEEIVQQLYGSEMHVPLQEGKIRREDGSLLDVEVAATSYLETGGRVVQGVLRNITQRKLAEVEHARLIRAIEQVGESIVITDLDASIVYVNPAFEKLTGYTRAEAIGNNPHVLKSGCHPPSFYQEMWATLLRGETWSGALINKRKDGTLCQEEATISPIKNQDGKIINYVAVKRDITLRKQTEADLEQAKENAEAANRAKSEFLANMSHEIRTPMNGIVGMTDLLLDTELNDQQRRYAEIVRDSGQSLLRLMNDILDFSKIEARRLELETLDFDLQSLLNDFADTVDLRALEKGLDLFCCADPAVPTQLQGDPGRLRQILLNLVSNAIKFTSAGEVAIHVSVLQETENEVLLRFSVRDTGIGVPEDKLCILFDKFTQVDASTTRKYGGTGLGLAISRQLAEMMGGEIGVVSQAGKGSEFWFTVRMGKQPQEAEAESLFGPELRDREVQDLSRPFDGVSARILVAEDNITNQLVAQGILKKLGLAADVVANGAEAIKALESIPYDLVLMDVQMPVMDGFEATRQVRSPNATVPNHQIPIIAMTAHALQGDRQRCLEVGMNDYVSKPVSSQALTKVLAQWLPRRNEEREMVNETRTPPPSSDATSPVVFDRAGMLARLMDDENLAWVVTEAFLHDIPGQIEALRSYLEVSDAAGAARQAHLLKGAAANVGGEALRALASEMEKAGKTGDLGSVAARMNSLDHQFLQLKEAMTQQG